jgi:hypothetical protein
MNPNGLQAQERATHAGGGGRVPLISMRNINKSFGSLQALRGASIDVCGSA